jgi:hypothetical protein
MVDAAAALWSAVSTAGVTLTDKGALSEDVSGSNIQVSGTGFTVTGEQTNQLGLIIEPADVTPEATGFPVGVIFDEDGSVIDAIFGTGASKPSNCQNNSVYEWLDSVTPEATFAHGIIVLNGRCATSASLLQMMSFELERAFGRLLGLDFAQVNLGAATNGETNGTLGWPVMQPESGLCTSAGGACIPNPTVLRWDDVAALNRLYPITAANLSSFPGKKITAANTVSIQGTISFASGAGMQGVNVVARPLDANGNPLYQYTVSFVSGSYFNGNRGNRVSGLDDANGNPLTMWGSDETAMQGYYDLSGMPLPTGVNSASYQLSFETVDSNFAYTHAVGPYLDGSPEPSGTLAAVSVASLTAGSVKTLNFDVTNSATGSYQSAIGTEASPRHLALSGAWSGRLGQVGQSDWLTFPVRGGRSFSVVTVAVDESGAATDAKAMPALGLWDAADTIGSTPVAATHALNGLAVGESLLQVSVAGSDVVRLGIADERGDGRPDYAYKGWVLYADTVEPQRLPATGGVMIIFGMGFRNTDTVKVGGQTAVVTGIYPNAITAIAPAAATGVTGSVNVEVDDQPILYASSVITNGISYDSATGDALTLDTAPMQSVPIGVPQSFAVTAFGASLRPAGGVSVIYSLVSGTATLGCGKSTCTVTTTGDGLATLNVTATGTGWSAVTASLTNGSSVRAEFYGGTPPTLTSLSSMLSLAAGATFSWTPQALALKSGLPVTGQAISWQTSSSAITLQSTSSTTNANGIATNTLTVGPLTEGQTVTAKACLSGTSSCVTFTAFGARPEYAGLQAVSGTAQSLSDKSTASPIVLRVLDMDGNPMAGATVTLYQALYAWAPPCTGRGRCAASVLLSSANSAATSALDGSVSFTPASLSGVATKLTALAVTGNTASVKIAIEQHP